MFFKWKSYGSKVGSSLAQHFGFALKVGKLDLHHYFFCFKKEIQLPSNKNQSASIMPMPTTPFLILAFAIIQPVKSNCESFQKSTGGKNACDNPTHSVNACGATFDPTGWTSKMIEVTSDCALAASYYASELSDKNIGTAAGVNWQALQYGCSIHTDNNLYVNTKPDSKIKADGYGSRCSATTPCFCFIGKPCENTLAKIENTGACLCGVSACSSGTGLYCHLEASKCNPVPICTIIDGSAPNFEDCFCSSTRSSMATDVSPLCLRESSGRYCDSSQGLGQCSSSQWGFFELVPKKGDDTLSYSDTTVGCSGGERLFLF